MRRQSLESKPTSTSRDDSETSCSRRSARPAPLSQFATGRDLRRRFADAGVRSPATRRGKLHQRTVRFRRRPNRSRQPSQVRRPSRPDNPTLVRLLDKFLERRATISTEDQSPSVQRFREMIGRDEKMLIVFEWIRTAAKSDISVLILGPTGSGKEVVARMIHELSRRSTAKFQAVNCAALPDTLFESEIFGYEKGAFTGAHDRKPGRLETGQRGHPLPRRNRRPLDCGPGQAVARARRAALRASRRQQVDSRRFPPDFGHKSAAGPLRARWAIPRRSVLPRERVCHPAALAPRAPGGHSGSRQPISGAVLCSQRLAARCQVVCPRSARPADCLSLARQHPGAGKHRVARGAFGTRAKHPRR